jgi:hypothetical protein
MEAIDFWKFMFAFVPCLRTSARVWDHPLARSFTFFMNVMLGAFLTLLQSLIELCLVAGRLQQ